MKYYTTTYCNHAHRVSDGKPLQHECYILPPLALKHEMEDRFPEAILAIEQARPLRRHRGLRRP